MKACIALRSLLLAAALSGAGAVVTAAAAQGGPPMGPPGSYRGDDPRRAELERLFRERLDRIARERLQLSDEQAVRLREVASRTEDSRRSLRRDETAMRLAMRRELLAGDKADEQKIGELLEQMPRLERRRLELMEQEQKELTRFLSPVQRARYFALQDELRRGMQELQRRRLGDSSGGRDRGEPPRRRPPGVEE